MKKESVYLKMFVDAINHFGNFAYKIPDLPMANQCPKPFDVFGRIGNMTICIEAKTVNYDDKVKEPKLLYTKLTEHQEQSLKKMMSKNCLSFVMSVFLKHKTDMKKIDSWDAYLLDYRLYEYYRRFKGGYGVSRAFIIKYGRLLHKVKLHKESSKTPVQGLWIKEV